MRNSAETESYMNSVERILYTTNKTPQEQSIYSSTTGTFTIDATTAPTAPTATTTATTATTTTTTTTTTPMTSHTAPSLPILANENINYNLKTPQTMTDTELLSSGWPWKGGITFNHVTMRYREDFLPVLHNISLNINPGENLGIVVCVFNVF